MQEAHVTSKKLCQQAVQVCLACRKGSGVSLRSYTSCRFCSKTLVSILALKLPSRALKRTVTFHFAVKVACGWGAGTLCCMCFQTGGESVTEPEENGWKAKGQLGQAADNADFKLRVAGAADAH